MYTKLGKQQTIIRIKHQTCKVKCDMHSVCSKGEEVIKVSNLAIIVS